MGEQFVIGFHVPCGGGGCHVKVAHNICVKFRLKRVYDSINFAVCYLTRPLTRSYHEWAILPQWGKMAQMTHFLYWL